MRRYLDRLGLQVTEGKPAAGDDLKTILETVLGIHEQMMNDIILQQAAYGCAVGGLSLALGISLRTAAMVFDNYRSHRPSPTDNICVITVGGDDG
jgi:hypothetical protein